MGFRSRPGGATPTRPAYEHALGHLSRREFSALELRQKLGQAGHTAEAIDAAFERLCADGYLSDERYAQVATRSLLARGKGPRALQQKLSQAGISRSMAAAALPEELDWLAQARDAVERRFGATEAADLKEWARRARWLLARGYTEAQARAALGARPRPAAPAR